MVGHTLLDYELLMAKALPTRWLGGCVASFALLVPSAAHAQLHWDASAALGVEKRFLANRPAGAEDAGFGPSLQLAGHLALFPLVRAGLYAGYAISPLGGEAAARDMFPFGARFKIMSPFPRGETRAWLFLGIGYTLVSTRSYETTISTPTGIGSATTPRKVTVESAGGGFLGVPVGVGLSTQLFESLHLFGELGAHIGFAHNGSVYESPGPQLRSEGFPDDNALPSGKDRIGLGLNIGILLD